MVLSRLMQLNATIDEWFREHVVIWWVILVVIPGGAYAVAQVVISGESTSQAVVFGGVFGVVFATLTVGIQRWRRR